MQRYNASSFIDSIQKELHNLQELSKHVDPATSRNEEFIEPCIAIPNPEGLLENYEKDLKEFLNKIGEFKADDEHLKNMIDLNNKIVNDNLIQDITYTYNEILRNVNSGIFNNIIPLHKNEKFQHEIQQIITNIKQEINQPPYHLTVDKINKINQDYVQFQEMWKPIFELLDHAELLKKEKHNIELPIAQREARINILLHLKKSEMSAKRVGSSNQRLNEIEIELDTFKKLDELINKHERRGKTEFLQSIENDLSLLYRRYKDVLERIPSPSKRIQYLTHLKQAWQLQEQSYKEIPGIKNDILRNMEIMNKMLGEYQISEEKVALNRQMTEAINNIAALKAELKDIDSSKELMSFEKAEQMRHLKVKLTGMPLFKAIIDIDAINQFIRALETEKISDAANDIVKKIKSLENDKTKSPLDKLDSLKEMHKQLRIIYEMEDKGVLENMKKIVENNHLDDRKKTAELRNIEKHFNKSKNKKRKEVQKEVQKLIESYRKKFPEISFSIDTLTKLNYRQKDKKPSVWAIIVAHNTKSLDELPFKLEKKYLPIVENFKTDLQKIYAHIFSDATNNIVPLPQNHFFEKINALNDEIINLHDATLLFKFEEKQINKKPGLFSNASHATNCQVIINQIKTQSANVSNQIVNLVEAKQDGIADIYSQIVNLTQEYIQKTCGSLHDLLNNLNNNIPYEKLSTESNNYCNDIYYKADQYYKNSPHDSLSFLEKMLNFCVQLHNASLQAKAELLEQTKHGSNPAVGQ